MNKSQKKSYISLIAGSAAIAVLLYVGNVFLPREIEKSGSELVQNKKKIIFLQNQNAQVGAFRQNYGNIKEEMEAIYDTIVFSEKVVNFIAELESAAEKNGVKLEKRYLEKEEKNQNDNFSSAYFEISAYGKFSDLTHFLSYVENLKYFTEIENVNVNSNYEVKDDIKIPGWVMLKAKLKVYMKNQSNLE